LNVNGLLNVNGGTVTGGPIVVNTNATLFLGADDVLGSFASGPSSVTVNGGYVTAAAGTHSTLPAVTLNGGALLAPGPGNGVPPINYILNGNVTTVPNATPSTISAPAILLRGAGAPGPVTFTVPRGTAKTDLEVKSVIHDGGAGLIKNGDGILTLSGVNTYTGPTVINTGKLEANGSSSLGGSAVTLNNGGVLSLGSPPTFTGFPDVTLNGGATLDPTNNILTLTTDVGNQSRSAFTNTKYSVGDGFSASFVYTATGAAGPNGLADGITFTVQNNAPTALGAGGGGLGYLGILNSAALELNVYLGAGFPVGTALHEDGAIQGYISSAPVSLTSGNKIRVEVGFDPIANSFTETLTDLVTAAVYTNTFTNLTRPLSTILGGNLAYVGFTGATGGAQSYQTVEDFVFNDTSSQQNITLPNNITVSAGTTGGLEVAPGGSRVGSSAALTGVLTLNAGSVLNVTGGEVATDSPYLLEVTGSTTLAGNSTINVTNNGTGVGTARLDDVSQSGGSFSLTKIGEGTLVLDGDSSFSVLNSNEGTTNLDGTLSNATINANGGEVNIHASQTINGLNISSTGVVVLGGSAPAPTPLAFDAETGAAAAQAVPEPGNAILLLSGLSALLARRCRRRS
jgi:autotransporter-associated beta strand protein